MKNINKYKIICTYSSGDYNIAASDNCAVTAATDLGAMSFDGINDHIDLDDYRPITNRFTMSAWIYPISYDSGGDADTILSKLAPLGTHSHTLRLSSNGLINFAFNNGAGQSFNTNNNVAPLNVWTYVAAVYDASAGTMSVYINGNLSKNQSGIGTGNIEYGVTDMMIGALDRTDAQNYEQFFNGTIDEVKVYSRALTENEIRQQYMAGKLKGLTLNHSETKKNEKWNATVTLYDNATGISTPMNFSFGTIVSCGYLAAEGNWNIDGEDGCALDDNYALGINNVTMDGTGTFRFNGYNITEIRPLWTNVKSLLATSLLGSDFWDAKKQNSLQ